MKKLLAVLVFLIFVTSVSAVSQSQLEDFKQKYDNQTDEVPGFVGNIVGGETVNVEVNRSGDLETFGVKMDGVRIEEIQNSSYDDNTMLVETDKESIETVLSSDAPFEQIQEELDENDIEYSSTTTGGKVKLTVFKSLKGLAEAVGLQF